MKKKRKTRSLREKEESQNKNIATDTRNCFYCDRFKACKEIGKSWKFVCPRFKKLPDINFTELKKEADESVKKEKPKKGFNIIVGKDKEKTKDNHNPNPKDLLDPDGFNFITEALDAVNKFNKSPLPSDYEIDDSDAPLAKNVFEFMTSPEFLGFPSFSRQIQMGAELFSEICPLCSNPKWVERGFPLKGVLYDEEGNPDFDRIKRNVVFLEYGRCPRCSASKIGLIKKGLLNPYVEFCGVIGQRCVTGDTLIPTSSGIFKISDLNPSDKEGFKLYSGPDVVLNNGAVVRASKFFYKKNEKVIKITTENGFEIAGTPEHPIFTNKDWVKIKNLKVGTPIPIYYGQNIWGNKDIDLGKDINPKARKIATKTIRNRALKIDYYSGKLTDSMYRVLGFWVAEGCGGKATLTNLDKSILRDCKEAFTSLYGKDSIYESYNSIGSHREWAKIHFNILLNGGIENRSSDKEIPDIVLKAPKIKVVQFMRALFEGDGGFNKDCVEYCTISEVLIKQISLILNNLGIIHRIKTGKTWATNGSKNQIKKTKYSIFIEGPVALRQFKDSIGFISQRKSKRLDATIHKLENRVNKVPFWYEKLPTSIKKEFLSLIEEVSKDVGQYNVWDKNTHRKYRQTYGKFSFISRNDKFWRIKADNVCLTVAKIKRILNLFRNNPLWRLVSDFSKQKMYAFELKYTQDGVYWTTIKEKVSVGRQDVYDFHVPKHHSFMANGFYNHNSGKSEISRQWLLYTLHRFLKLQKPAITYGLGPTSKLTFTLMAQTFAKAKRDLYDPVYATLTSCPWFVKYHEILSYYSEKSGVELFRVKDTFASYRLSNIDLLPETPDTRNLRGATRAGGILDELDWIDSNDGTKKNTSGVRTNVEEIYVSVSRSFATIRMAYERMIKTRKTDKIIDRNILPPPMLLGISSPSSTKSIMMKNLALSQTSRILYGAHMPTWEVNPDLPKNSETIQLEFKRNFDRAMRDFGAQPPHSANPFIRDIETMQAVVSPYKNLVKSKPKYITSNSGTVMLSAKIKFMQPKDNINRIMAIDAGESFNSFVIGTGFYDEEENEIICDSIVEIIPEPDIKINFNAVCANVIGDMIERLNVSFLVADRWQSAKLLSDFEDIFGIYTQTYSLKYNDMSAVRVDVYDGHFKLPKCEVPIEQVEDLALDDYPFGFQSKPVAHLLHQFITVRDFGKEVTKGIGFTDDIFRMFCLLHKFIADPEYREFCSGVRIGETKQITPILGVVGSRFQGPGIKAAAGGGSGMITSSDGAPIGVSASRRKQAGF